MATPSRWCGRMFVSGCRRPESRNPMHCGRSARDFSVVGPPVGNLPDCAGGRSEFGGSRCCPRPRQTARPALNSTTRLPTTPAIPCAESSARFPGIAGCLRFTMASSRRRSRALGAWRFAGCAASRGSPTAWGTPAGRVVVLIVGGGLPVSPGYDLVVIDLMRPELDGFDGGRAIRASALAGQ